MSSHPSSERIGALDGVRAVALLAVVAYHVDPSTFSGGFVGVDLFFVLSGYLITTLLLEEHRRNGRIALCAFWMRRARRLLPLAWSALALVAVASLLGVWGADRQRTLPIELGAAVAHVANWYQAAHDGYLGSFAAPSPVRHFWSLAIEEQFYLVWPVLLGGALAARRRWRHVVPALLATLGAVSVAAGLTTAGSADRAYLGTDVRAIALVVGAFLAWRTRATPMSMPTTGRVRRSAGLAGAIGAVGLAGGLFVFTAESKLLAQGGFLAIAIGAAGLIAATLATPFAAGLFSAAPLAHLGRLSYAVYLVHWPLLVALGPDRHVALRALVALPLSIAIAELAHRLVERPVQAGRPRTPTLAVVGVGLVCVAVLALVVSVPEGATPTEQVAESLEPVPDPAPTSAVPSAPSAPTSAVTSAATSPGVSTEGTAPTTDPTTTTTTACAPAPGPGPSFEATGRFDPATVEEIADPSSPACGEQVKVLVVGDSTGRGAANGLAALADPRLQVWDRTTLGCSFGGEDCPTWRDRWAVSVAGIDPDVVLVYGGVVSDFVGIDDPPFLSGEADTLRISQLDDAARLLSSAGARVYFVTPAVPLRPNGLFFCDGDGSDTNCDPEWVARWNESVRVAAAQAGAGVIDVGRWIAERGATARDRPDGLHLAGPALVDHATWLVPQLLAA